MKFIKYFYHCGHFNVITVFPFNLPLTIMRFAVAASTNSTREGKRKVSIENPN
jgi:hypothetical protein